METINNKPQEKAIICILQDAIIWKRVSDSMYTLLNAFNPIAINGDQENFDLEERYLGYENNFKIMGISDNYDLCQELSELFWSMQDTTSKANELAEKIYIEWLVCIKNYCATLKTVA